jgi:LmbE family N-acetylglucosaminyl deacetylase
VAVVIKPSANDPPNLAQQVVVSAHLDDAVLSAWSVLTGGGRVTVTTVFAGVPEPGLVTDLDRSHGASDSAALMRRRRADDHAVLEPLGCDVVHLDLPEIQMPAYRIPRIRRRIAAEPQRFLDIVRDEPELQNDPDELADLVLDRVRADAVLHGPSGIGGHPDHRDLAAAMIRIARRGRAVRLYADSPYYLFHGVPGVVTRRAVPRADRWVRDALAALVADPAELAPHVVRLDDAALSAKRRAVAGYGTETPFIDDEMRRLGIDPDDTRHEIFWTMPDARP